MSEALAALQKERAVAEEELAQWERRVRNAKNRGEPLLRKTAEQKVEELKSLVTRLLEQEKRLIARENAPAGRGPA